MPVIGSKRRNSSEATCDSSHCAFCFQRSRSGLSCIQHDSCPDQTHDSSASQPSNEFETWLKAQTVSTAAHEHISLDKIGLQLPGLLRSPPSKRNRTSIDLGEASSSDSSDPNQLSLPAIYEAGLSLDMPCLSGTAGPPWQWSLLMVTSLRQQGLQNRYSAVFFIAVFMLRQVGCCAPTG